MLLLGFEFIEIVVVILHTEDPLLDDLDLILGLEVILVLIEGRYKVFVENRMQLDGVNMRQFLLINVGRVAVLNQFVQLPHGTLKLILLVFLYKLGVEVVLARELHLQLLIGLGPHALLGAQLHRVEVPRHFAVLHFY